METQPALNMSERRNCVTRVWPRQHPGPKPELPRTGTLPAEEDTSATHGRCRRARAQDAHAGSARLQPGPQLARGYPGPLAPCSPVTPEEKRNGSLGDKDETCV